MRQIIRFIVLASIGAMMGSTAFGGAVTPGNIIVLRVGDGTAALTNVATAIFLDEYTPAGSLVQTINVPSSGANACTVGGTATTEGMLHVSADGAYITFGGYALDAGTATPAAATNSRVLARLSVAGVLDTSTRMDTTLGSATSIRGVVSNDGTQFWASTADKGAVYIGTFGSAQAGVQLNTASTNLRDIGIFGNQLYVSSASTPNRGVCTLGTGLPTTTGQTVTLLTGFPGAATSNANSFQFDSGTRIFEVDTTFATQGLLEWTLSAGTWSVASSQPLTGTGNWSLTIGMDGSTPSIFVTDNANSIKKTPKASPLAALTQIVTAGTNTAFRGIATFGGGSAVRDWSLY